VIRRRAGDGEERMWKGIVFYTLHKVLYYSADETLYQKSNFFLKKFYNSPTPK